MAYSHCMGQVCARFGLICANSCTSHNRIAMEIFTPARCKTVKIHQNEHTPGLGTGINGF